MTLADKLSALINAEMEPACLTLLQNVKWPRLPAITPPVQKEKEEKKTRSWEQAVGGAARRTSSLVGRESFKSRWSDILRSLVQCEARWFQLKLLGKYRCTRNVRIRRSSTSRRARWSKVLQFLSYFGLIPPSWDCWEQRFEACALRLMTSHRQISSRPCAVSIAAFSCFYLNFCHQSKE